ncbi:MAG: T9SS type B sorting domain-containing protein [Flavobacterium sp.]|nr:T9SS type B sorting domain-containing protein [Flavobacterium sp.]
MCKKIFLVLSFFLTISSVKAFGYRATEIINDTLLKKFNPKNKLFSNVAPILIATGNQVYCPLSNMKIVTNMIFTDPDDTGVDAVYIQISSGYIEGQDFLTLSGSHPTIISQWNPTSGKLTLTGVAGIQPTYLDLESAIKDIDFFNNTATPSGIKNFSITIGQANYLPSNGHYYQYIPNIGITWTNAKIAAQNSTYYGLQGYLATITSAEEAQLSGAQASGAGWIGGSDEQVEGVWRWMTGPEIGLNFWNGLSNGNTPNFAFWNTGEPNSSGNEDYAHITAPGVGITGSWNDLSDTGEPIGNYQPKGYIVEYGGMPGDPILQISTSSTIAIPIITTTTPSSTCDSGTLTLNATAANGTIKWYQNPTGGIVLATGDSYTTPPLTATATYYVDAFPIGCNTGTRTPILATINVTPTVNVSTNFTICGNNTANLMASSNVGTINWFDSLTNVTPVATGNTFTTPILNQQTTYYVQGTNNGCLSAKIPVTVNVYQLPNVSDETYNLCENATLTLDAGISNATFLWSSGATSQTITTQLPGFYMVVVTSLAPENCSKTKTITVNQIMLPLIISVTQNGGLALINYTGNGNYEFSIDGENYQDSNIFTVLNGGQYTAYIRDKNNCGADKFKFIVVSMPAFFTPNNDGINDYFSIKGLEYYPASEVKIYDRYGKLILVLNSINNFWDGTFNGKLLPSDDYWYSFKIDQNDTETKGHFSLKR